MNQRTKSVQCLPTPLPARQLFCPSRALQKQLTGKSFISFLPILGFKFCGFINLFIQLLLLASPRGQGLEELTIQQGKTNKQTNIDTERWPYTPEQEHMHCAGPWLEDGRDPSSRVHSICSRLVSLRVCLNLSKFLLIYRRRVTFVLTQGSCKDKMKKRKKKDAEVIYAIHRRVATAVPLAFMGGNGLF